MRLNENRFALVLLIAFRLGAQSVPAPDSRELTADELVLANHILIHLGVVDAYGHVSVRDPKNRDHFFLSRSLAPGEVTAPDIQRYDLDGNSATAPKSTIHYLERFIHSEIYRARPDVMAVVHAHSPEVIPFSISSIPLRPTNQMAAFLAAGIPTFEIRNFSRSGSLLISSSALGRNLAETLGDSPAALMRGHGDVVVGPSLHIAVARSYYLVVNARLQLDAIKLGGSLSYLNEIEAQKATPPDNYERAWSFWKKQLTQ